MNFSLLISEEIHLPMPI